MKQHGMRQVSYDTEVGKITTDYRVFDVRRPICSFCPWTQDAMCISRRIAVGIRGSQTFKTVVEGSKHTGTQSDDSSKGRASLATPSAEERTLHEASGHVPYRSPRIEFDFADLGREEDQVLPTPSLNADDVGSESLSAIQ